MIIMMIMNLKIKIVEFYEMRTIIVNTDNKKELFL